MKKILIATAIVGLLTTASAVDMCRHYAVQLSQAIKDGQKANKEGMKKQEQQALRMLVHYTNETIIACDEGTPGYNFGKKIQAFSKKIGLK